MSRNFRRLYGRPPPSVGRSHRGDRSRAARREGRRGDCRRRGAGPPPSSRRRREPPTPARHSSEKAGARRKRAESPSPGFYEKARTPGRRGVSVGPPRGSGRRRDLVVLGRVISSEPQAEAGRHDGGKRQEARVLPPGRPYAIKKGHRGFRTAVPRAESAAPEREHPSGAPDGLPPDRRGESRAGGRDPRRNPAAGPGRSSRSRLPLERRLFREP